MLICERDGLRVDAFVTGKWRENCYVLTDTGRNRAVIVDPGDDASSILSHLESTKVEAERILFTHAHYDHVGAAAEIGSAHSVSCAVHEFDVPLLRRAPAYALSFEKRIIRVPKEVQTFSTEQSFDFGAHTVKIVACPGHTPGGVFFWVKDLLFSGDSLLHKKRGRTDLPGGNEEQLKSSLDETLASLPPELTILPGHGETWNVKEAHTWWLAEPRIVRES